MGGAAGHLSHLWENYELTFGEIKDVIRSAAAGKLSKSSEKLDGMNLVFSYDLQNQHLKVARSAGDIKRGGMDAATLAKKFTGRGNIEEAFNSAFKVLEQSLTSLTNEEKLMIFGPYANKWYSIEVIYTQNPNIINYDSNNIVFHNWPIFEVLDDKTVEQTDDDGGVDILNAKIDQMQKSVSLKNWSVRGPLMMNMKKISDGTITANAIAKIDDAMTWAGVDDNSTIYDYLRALMTDEALKYGIPKAALKATVERAITAPGHIGVPELKKMVSKSEQASIADFIKSSEELLKKLVFPLEEAISIFAIEVLRGMKSTFVSNSDEEVQRLRTTVSNAINAIQSSGNQAAMDVLEREMKRLGSVENISSSTEGTVFFYKGQAYKFTGAFAPINQILSLFRYGKKGIPILSKESIKLKNVLHRMLDDCESKIVG